MSVGLKYSGGSAEKGFFKLGIVEVKGKSWNQEMDKEAMGRSRGAKKKNPNQLNDFVCQCGSVCVCMEQFQGTSLVHNKAIHLVYDSFNGHVPLMLYCRRKCVIATENLKGSSVAAWSLTRDIHNDMVQY